MRTYIVIQRCNTACILETVGRRDVVSDFYLFLKISVFYRLRCCWQSFSYLGNKKNYGMLTKSHSQVFRNITEKHKSTKKSKNENVKVVHPFNLWWNRLDRKPECFFITLNLYATILYWAQVAKSTFYCELHYAIRRKSISKWILMLYAILVT